MTSDKNMESDTESIQKGSLDKKFRFRNFQVYKDARIFSRDVKQFSKKKFPRNEQFALQNQLWRALDSIILNIAEGADRGTDKDFALFLNRAHTSLNEVVACLDVATDCGYITGEDHTPFLLRAYGLANQLTAFRKNILSQSTK